MAADGAGGGGDDDDDASALRVRLRVVGVPEVSRPGTYFSPSTINLRAIFLPVSSIAIKSSFLLPGDLEEADRGLVEDRVLGGVELSLEADPF